MFSLYNAVSAVQARPGILRPCDVTIYRPAYSLLEIMGVFELKGDEPNWKYHLTAKGEKIHQAFEDDGIYQRRVAVPV